MMSVIASVSNRLIVTRSAALTVAITDAAAGGKEDVDQVSERHESETKAYTADQVIR